MLRPALRLTRWVVAASVTAAAFLAMAAVHVHMAVTLPGGPDGMSDLRVYLGAVRTWWAGGSLYDFVSFNGDRFLYPPFAGLVLAPWALLPEPSVLVLWTLVQCAEVVALAWLVVARTSVPFVRRLPRPFAVGALSCLLMLSHPVFTGIFLGQVSLLVSLLALLDVLDVTPRRWRGVPLGVAAAVKLTPLAFVPYLWLTGRRREALVAVGTWTACTGLAVLVLPDDSRRYWPTGLSTPAFVDLAQPDNQSLTGLLARLGWTGGGSSAVLLVLTLLVTTLGYARSRRAYAAGDALAGAVIVGAMVVLVSPISWNHHQSLLVVAAACPLAAGRLLRRAWPLVVWCLMSVPVQALLLWSRPSPRPLLDNLVLVLAVLLACALPLWTHPNRSVAGKRQSGCPGRSAATRL